MKMTEKEMAEANAEMAFDQSGGYAASNVIAQYADNVLDTLRDWGIKSEISGNVALARYYARVAELLVKDAGRS